MRGTTRAGDADKIKKLMASEEENPPPLPRPQGPTRSEGRSSWYGFLHFSAGPTIHGSYYRYLADFLTLSPFAQQKASNSSLRLVLQLSMVLNCSVQHTSQYYSMGQPAGTPVPFIILHICPDTNTTWRNMTHTSSQGTQLWWSWASQLSHPGKPPLLWFLWSHSWCPLWTITHMVLHTALFLPYTSNASAFLCPRVLSVHTSALQSLWDHLHHWSGSQNHLSLCPLMSKACDIQPHYIGSRPSTTLTGTGLVVTTLDTKQHVIKVNPDLWANPAKHTGLLYQSPALMQQQWDSLPQTAWITV